MADFLFSIATSLTGKLTTLAMQEGSLMLTLHDDLREINQTLSIVKALLLDAGRKIEGSSALSVWLNQLKVVFSDAEDLVDEIEYDNLRKQAMIKAHGTAKAKVGRFFSSSNPLVFHYKMARRTIGIKNRLAKVAADRHNFGLRIIDDDNFVITREMTHSSVIVSELDVVGRKTEKEEIINVLTLTPPNGPENLQVLPVVGVAGLGKTTIAKLVFNDERITKSFRLRIWVCLSDEVKFNMKHTIIKILNAAHSTIAFTPANQHGFDKLDLGQLVNLLNNRLANQKLLLVLDDVGDVSGVEWVILRDLMEVVAKGSRILMTTRQLDAAQVMGTFCPCELPCLPEVDAMSLFVRWAFDEGEERRHAALMEVGRDIVKNCSGIPLALITIGSLLFSKFDIGEWIYVRDHPIWELLYNLFLHSDLFLLRYLTKISFDEMPSYSKHCFALFSLYPMGYTFDSFSVTSLWGALGLLPSGNSNQIFKYGVNQYLNELRSRSFLQDFVDYGVGSAFKVHSVMHNLANHLAGGDDFQLISYTNPGHCARHMSFMAGDFPPISPHSSLKVVRTILFPIAGVGANGGTFLKSVSRCKHLRFLDFSDSTYETLPRSISKLKLLRYISLENNRRLKRLPGSICKLYKLEFLILRGCTELEALPECLGNLVNLLCLELTTKQHVLPEHEFANLTSLQTLRIEFCNNLESLFGGIRLSTLRVLVVANCSSLKWFPLDIEHFPMLETLSIDNCGKLEVLGGHGDQNSNLKLKSLHFVSLPQLVTLPHWLRGSSNTLEYLLISSCNNLVELPRWLSTMNLMKTLRITNCPNLLSRLNEIFFPTSIENLEFDGYPEFRRSQSQVGESSRRHTPLEEIEEELE